MFMTRERVARMISTPHFQPGVCDFESPREKNGWELLEEGEKKTNHKFRKNAQVPPLLHNLCPKFERHTYILLKFYYRDFWHRLGVLCIFLDVLWVNIHHKNSISHVHTKLQLYFISSYHDFISNNQTNFKTIRNYYTKFLIEKSVSTVQWLILNSRLQKYLLKRVHFLSMYIVFDWNYTCEKKKSFHQFYLLKFLIA